MPFYKISKWILIAQGIIALFLFVTGCNLLSAWDDKKIKTAILLGKNKDEFRPDTFEVFMQAPCGRLVVCEALRDLNMQEQYKTLLKLQKPLLERMRNNCMPSKTVIFISGEKI